METATAATGHVHCWHPIAATTGITGLWTLPYICCHCGRITYQQTTLPGAHGPFAPY
jgi:hypothetical protein